MASLILAPAWTVRTARSPLAGGIVRRLHVLVRAHRIAASRRARIRLVHAESHDPRLLADIGIDPRRHRRYDWIGEMARAMGGR